MVTMLNLYETKNTHIHLSAAHPGYLLVNPGSSDNASGDYLYPFSYAPSPRFPVRVASPHRRPTSCFSYSIANS